MVKSPAIDHKAETDEIASEFPHIRRLLPRVQLLTHIFVCIICGLTYIFKLQHYIQPFVPQDYRHLTETGALVPILVLSGLYVQASCFYFSLLGAVAAGLARCVVLSHDIAQIIHRRRRRWAYTSATCFFFGVILLSAVLLRRIEAHRAFTRKRVSSTPIGTQ